MKKGHSTKKVSLDYDSDDGRLIELKKQGHSDEYVAEKLKEEKRTEYQPKTVNSRWTRLRKLLSQQEDERLDDELSDWHEGEDGQLGEIVKAVDQKFERQFQLLEERKWSEISWHLAEKLGRRKYTGKACRERVQGLKDGTALTPIELAENPEERRQMTEHRIAAAKQARQDAKDALRAKEQRAEARAAAKKAESRASNKKKIDDAIQKRAEKEENERIKEERKENKEKMKQHRIAMQAQFRAEKEWNKTRRDAEKKLYKALTGFSIDGSRPGRMRKKKDGYESEDEAEAPDESESDEDEDEMIELSDHESDEQSELDDADLADDEVMPTIEEQEQEQPEPTSSGKKGKNKAIPENQAGHIPAPVTKQTLLNPRSILSDDELAQLLYFRRLTRRGHIESHAEVVARIAASDESLKSDDLSQLLMHKSEKSKGKKTEKIARLQEADARGSDAGQMGSRSTDLDFIKRYEGYKGGFEYLVAEIERERQAEAMAGRMEE